MGKKRIDSPGCPWSDVYLLNIHRIDDQHKGLFYTLNVLHEALMKEDDLPLVDKLMSDLIRQTRVHFRTEEEFMQVTHYPGYEEHRNIHEMLLRQVEDLQAAQQALTASNVRQHWIDRQETCDFLSLWLVDHIQMEDKKLGAFLKEQGIE